MGLAGWSAMVISAGGAEDSLPLELPRDQDRFCDHVRLLQAAAENRARMLGVPARVTIVLTFKPQVP